MRLGAADIHTERVRVQREFGLAVSEVEVLEGVVAWCNFTDPRGRN